jgi:hypothetical protein
VTPDSQSTATDASSAGTHTVPGPQPSASPSKKPIVTLSTKTLKRKALKREALKREALKREALKREATDTMRYQHIVSEDTRCWCGPKRIVEETTTTEEILPGIFMSELVERTIIIHLENAMHPRRHGKPARSRHLAEMVHL